MKFLIFVAIVACFAFTIIGVSKSNPQVGNMHTRISAVLPKLKEMKSSIDQKIPTISSSDFGIKNQDTIHGLQSAIDQKQGKLGVQGCQSKLNNGIQSFLQEFRDSTRTRLSKTSQDLNARINILKAIDSNLGEAGMSKVHESNIAIGEQLVKEHYTEYTSSDLLNTFAAESSAMISSKVGVIANDVNGCLSAIK